MPTRREHDFRGSYGRGPRVINGMELTITTNASGDGTWTFPSPFPNTLIGFQITEVSNPAVLGAVIIKGWRPSSTFSDRTKVAFRAYDSAGAVIANFGVTVNITAWGV